ncbi:MAG: trehalose-phosphatase [Actinomycetota bacterium]|nr:trehalose-phosphatase [Actinomycetota bacterium]
MLDVDATISAIAANPLATVFLFDFDGTVSPIVEHPADARPHPEVVALVRELVERLGRVGIVSGRSISFLAEQLPIPGLAYAGLYGLETREPGGERRIDPRVEAYLDVVETAAVEAEARLPGVLVERKDGVSVTMHWRMTPERAAEIKAVATELGERLGLDAPQRGRMAVELRPPVPVDKGTTVRAMIDGYDVAVFAGDDAGDLAAFDALARAEADGVVTHGIRVGVMSTDAPEALAASVDFVVDGPEGFVAFLRSVVAGLRE